MKNRIIFPNERIYQKPILTIREDKLPITNSMCFDADASTCKEINFTHISCVDPCFAGMAPLTYDKNNKILYFTVASTNIGTGGGDYFLYSANIITHQINFIKIIGNPLAGSISPDGRYLTFSGFNGTTVYNLQNKEEIHLSEKNNWNWDNGSIHLLGEVKWLNNTQFTYHDGLRHHKFQHSFDEMKEITYDVARKEVIRTRIMKKNEYDSTPYVES